jgi:ATP-dependent helicase HrpB
MVVAAAGARDIARACAVLSERHVLPPRRTSTTSDLLSALDDWSSMPAHVRRSAARISDFSRRRAEGASASLAVARAKSLRAEAGFQSSDLVRDLKSQNQSEFCNLKSEMSEAAFRRAVLAGYPDRVAQRREPRSPNVLLASGTGAMIARESGVHEGEFLVALDVGTDSRVGSTRTAVVRIASVVEREWLQPTSSDVVHRFEKATGVVSARRVDRYDALTLAEHPVEPNRDIAAQLLADAWMERGPDAHDERLLRRIRFLERPSGAHGAPHVSLDVKELIREAARGARKLDDIRLSRAVPATVVRTLDRDAPETLIVPSGRAVRLTYNEDGTVGAAVKLQDLFGLADTPRVGPHREPVVLSLLAPNGRPVQVTTDLRGFWERTYPEVRRELRGRYPKHRWPEKV